MLGKCSLVAVAIFGFALGLVFLPDAEEVDRMELDLGMFAAQVTKVLLWRTSVPVHLNEENIHLQPSA
jgi:hypothetical protein